MVSGQAFTDTLAALERITLQKTLDAAVLMEKAQVENNEADYNYYLSIYHRWETILSQIECIVSLTKLD